MRINPYELHINNPDYYEELYSGPTQRRDKWEWSAKMFANPGSMFSTVPHDTHRMRRASVGQYLSRRSVVALEPMVAQIVENLCSRFTALRESRQVVNLRNAYSAMAIDVITGYCFADSYHCIEKEDFGSEWPEMMEAFSELGHLIKQFGTLSICLTQL